MRVKRHHIYERVLLSFTIRRSFDTRLQTGKNKALIRDYNFWKKVIKGLVNLMPQIINAPMLLYVVLYVVCCMLYVVYSLLTAKIKMK